MDQFTMSIYNNDEATKDVEAELNAMLGEQDNPSKDDSKDAPKKSTTDESDEDDIDEEEEDEEAEDEKSDEDLEGDGDKSKEDSEEGDKLKDDEESDDEDGEQSKKRKKDGDELIPKWKMKAEISRREKEIRAEIQRETEAEAARVAALKPAALAEESAEVQEFVKKFGLKENGPEFIKELGKLIAKDQGVDEIKKRQEERDTAERLAREEAEGFEKDWNKTQTSTISKMFPEISDKELAHVKKKVHELAYTPKYANYSLDDIIRLNKSKLLGEKRKSFESHKPLGKQNGMKSFDLDRPESIPWNDLSPEEFGRVSDELAKRSPQSTRITRVSNARRSR